MNILLGGFKTIRVNDRFQKKWKIGWWDLDKSLKP